MLRTYQPNSHFLSSNTHQDVQSVKATFVNITPVQQVPNALLSGLQFTGLLLGLRTGRTQSRTCPCIFLLFQSPFQSSGCLHFPGDFGSGIIIFSFFPK